MWRMMTGRWRVDAWTVTSWTVSAASALMPPMVSAPKTQARRMRRMFMKSLRAVRSAALSEEDQFCRPHGGRKDKTQRDETQQACQKTLQKPSDIARTL